MGRSGRYIWLSSCEDDEANKFAMELLIPQNELLKKIEEGENRVKYLATYFQVSVILLSHRCEQLGFKRVGRLIPFEKCDAIIIKSEK